eukprot:Opistho-1_new@47403
MARATHTHTIAHGFSLRAKPLFEVGQLRLRLPKLLLKLGLLRLQPLVLLADNFQLAPEIVDAIVTRARSAVRSALPLALLVLRNDVLEHVHPLVHLVAASRRDNVRARRCRNGKAVGLGAARGHLRDAAALGEIDSSDGVLFLVALEVLEVGAAENKEAALPRLLLAALLSEEALADDIGRLRGIASGSSGGTGILLRLGRCLALLRSRVTGGLGGLLGLARRRRLVLRLEHVVVALVAVVRRRRHEGLEDGEPRLVVGVCRRRDKVRPACRHNGNHALEALDLRRFHGGALLQIDHPEMVLVLL